MPLGHFGPVYSGPCGEVNRRVVIGVGRAATRTTLKLRLALAVGFLAMATDRTCATGISRVNGDNGHSVQLALVGQELAKLSEGPAAHLGSLLFTEPCALADVRQVFQRNSARRVFGKQNERLADNVIRVAAETALLVADPSHGAASVLSCATLTGHLPSERAADVVVLYADGLDMLPADMLAVAGGDELIDAKINAQELLDFNGSLVGQVDGAEQVELPIAVDQVALALEPVESLPLVFAEDDRDDLPTLQGENANPIHTLEGHQSLIENHSAQRLEHRVLSFVALEAINGLSDCANGHLARQTESFTKFTVTECMNARLTESVSVETDLGRMAGSSIERTHSVQQHRLLIGVRQNCNLDRKFHWTKCRMFPIPSQAIQAALKGGVSTRNS